jgi:hypothetical protein
MNNPYYPRKRHTGTWLLFFIIVIAIVLYYANSKGIINLGSLNLGNISLSGSQTNAQACIQKVTDCGNIIHLKYSYNVSILNNTIAQNANDANQFLGIWKGSSQSGSITNYNVSSYPITLVATRFDNSDGTKSPYIFICKSDGNLEEKTNSGFC